MLDDYLDQMLSRGTAMFYGVTIGGGMLLLLLCGWLWWHYSYLNPQTVFWDTVNNNLIISGVTKRTVTQDNSGKLDQYDQIGLGAQNMVKSIATVTQNGENNQKSTVVTQTVGTPSANFARYTKIDTTQKTVNNTTLDFSKVINQWSKEDLNGNAEGTFANAIFDVVPFAHLNAAQREQVVNDAKSGKVYDVDFDNVEKDRKDGRLFYAYSVAITPDKYINLLKQVDGMMGLNQLKNLDPSQYQGGAPIQVKIIIDAKAHQLASVIYVDNQRQETYSAWGAQFDTSLPDKTIGKTDLQTKLNVILSGQ